MALTSRAPLNRNQFQSFLLKNVKSAPSLTVVGAGSILEPSDTVAGSGAQSLSGSGAIIEPANTVAGVGTQGSAGAGAIAEGSDVVVGSGAQSTSGSGAISEQSDTVLGTGSVAATLRLVSSLNPSNLGPGFSAPFNLNQFKPLQQGSTSKPAIVGLGSIAESSDAVAGSGAQSLSGSGAIQESNDTVSGAGGTVGSGSGAIAENADVVAGSGATSTSGSAAIQESADQVSGSGAKSLAGSGAIAEAADVVNGVGSQSTSGSGAITETADAASGSGSSSAPFAGSGAVQEPSDTSTGSGSIALSGIGAITDRDVALGFGDSGHPVIPATYLFRAEREQFEFFVAKKSRFERNEMNDHVFDSIDKDPGDSRSVELEFFNRAANFWRPNEQFATNEYARPNLATGFAYQATTAGTSALREPRWPVALGATVNDGSVVWTCTVANSNGINALSAPSAVSDPTGMTISAVSISETSKILATYSGGSAGQSYDAVFSYTINGVARVARQTVRVRYK